MKKSSQVKMLVRIRGSANTKPVSTTPILTDTKNLGNKSKSPTFGNTTGGLNKSLNTLSRGTSKSPTKNTTPVIKSEGLNENAKYTIFTSINASNTVCTTNKPIAGKLINNTFLKTSDLYEYSYSILKDSTLLEFDKIYNETHKLDTVYQDNIKECISNLFSGKNSSVFFFGPSEGGKSYTLRGADGEVGILARAITDVFNLVEINKQSNINNSKKNINTPTTFFAAKISIYQIYLDQVNDLLSNTYHRNLKLEKVFDEERNQYVNSLTDLQSKECRNKKDYDNIMKEAVQYRKALGQYLKVNDLKKKSTLVLTITLERRERVEMSKGKINEKAVEKYSQIDFIELPSSNYGLNNQHISLDDNNISTDNAVPMKEPGDDIVFRDISKTFNSLSNNITLIASGNSNINTKYESKLTNCLKDTLNPESQIIFLSCVHSDETPPTNSFKALKFSNWLRNQILNQLGTSGNNFNNNNNKNQMDDYNRNNYDSNNSDNEVIPVRMSQVDDYNNNMNNDINVTIPKGNVIKGRDNNNNNKHYSEDEEDDRMMNQPQQNNYNNNNNNTGRYKRDNPNNLSNNNYSGNSGNEDKALKRRIRGEKDQSDEDQDVNNVDEAEMRELRNRMKKKYPYVGGERDGRENNRDQSYAEIKSLRTIPSPMKNQRYPVDSMNNSGNNFSQTGSRPQQTLNPKDKLYEMEKSLRDLEQKSLEITRHLENAKNDRSTINNPGVNYNNTSYMVDYEHERLKQEFATLKSDNIIFREDVNRLSELNRHLEEELTKQRNRNLELAAENENVLQEKNQLINEIDKLSQNVNIRKVQEGNLMEQFNQRFLLENKIRELENENKQINESKQKFEVDFRVLQERHQELKKNYELTDNELNFIKNKQTEEVNNIEAKLDKMTKDMDYMARENANLRSSDERMRMELNNLEKQRDNYREKYQDYKNKNNLMTTKLTEIEDDFRKLMLEKQNEFYEKRRDEETKKIKVDSKAKIIEDMQSRISSYKAELLRQRIKKDD